MPDDEMGEEAEAGATGERVDAGDSIAGSQPEVPPADAETDALAADDESGVDDEPAGDDEQGARPRSGQRETLAEVIETLERTGSIGTLILHFAERDVEFVLDGPSAMRAMTMLSKRRELGLADRLSPSSSPDSCWYVFDLKEPLAASWIPGARRPQRRTAVDPQAALPA